MSLDAFRRAMEGGEPEAIRAALAEDVVLHSPVTSRPFHGRDLVGALLVAARETLDGLTYGHELAGDGRHALTFTATVGGRPASGVDLVVLDGRGLVREFTATIRPLGAAQAFNVAMGERVAPLLGGTAGGQPTR